MKMIGKAILIALLILAFKQSGEAQGFMNLNFESANVSGYSPGIGSIPMSSALPGWTGFYGTNQTSQVSYDGISLGGYVISVIDSNAPAFSPLKGRFSAFLFGGGIGPFLSVTISQTSLVPVATESLRFDAYVYGAPFVVTLGGQAINMIPLQSFSNYTAYAGDISSFAGQVATLSFTEPPATGVQPSMFELDNIVFSPSSVPEPGTLGFLVLGGAAAAWRHWRK